MLSLVNKCMLRSLLRSTFVSFSTLSDAGMKRMDKLFTKVELEIRGHDEAVMLSYTTFLKNACSHLKIESSPVEKLNCLRWIPYALRAKFAKKKYKLHYETRTYINKMSIYNVTGSTASTFLEYIQRNIPEGIGMKVTYNEIFRLPEAIRQSISS